MRQILKTTAYGVSLVLCLVLLQSPAVSQQSLEVGEHPVDFRMTPLEQAKKISTHVRSKHDGAMTLTVMNKWRPGERKDRQHLIVPGNPAIPSAPLGALGQLLVGNVDSVSWVNYDPTGTCDSNRECERKVQDMCTDAGHGGVKPTTVKVTVNLDGSKTCSGDCRNNGAIAFVTCDTAAN